MNDDELRELAKLIRKDTIAGDHARTLLGLGWVPGPDRNYPSRRLASAYSHVTLARWRKLRADTSS